MTATVIHMSDYRRPPLRVVEPVFEIGDAVTDVTTGLRGIVIGIFDGEPLAPPNGTSYLVTTNRGNCRRAGCQLRLADPKGAA